MTTTVFKTFIRFSFGGNVSRLDKSEIKNIFKRVIAKHHPNRFILGFFTIDCMTVPNIIYYKTEMERNKDYEKLIKMQ